MGMPPSPLPLPDVSMSPSERLDPMPEDLRVHMFPAVRRSALPADEEWFGHQLSELLVRALAEHRGGAGGLGDSAAVAALASSARGVVITDATGTILWANAAWEQATGFPLEDARGRTPGSLVGSGEQDPAFYDDLWRTIQAGRVWRGVIRNRRRGGEFYAEDMIIVPVRTDGGAITHFAAVKAELPDAAG
jgi:PAS domain S-box-containing protein